MDFFKNMVNPQRTRGVVIEQIMDRQYKIRYGDDQHTKVATKNMVPVIEQATEANPVEATIDTEDVIEEDTGLTQQLRSGNPPTHKDTPGTDYQEEDDWPGPNEVSNSEYPEQQDYQISDSEDTASIVSSPIDILDEYQLEIDDPDEPDDTGYPDTLEVGTDTPQHSEETTCPEAAQKGTPTVTKEKPLLKETLSGSERTTRGKNKPGGAKDDNVGKTVITPLPDEFFSGKPRGRPLGVKPKNTAKVRFSEPLCEFGPKGEKDVNDEFSSQPGTQGASSSQDKTCRTTSSMILLEKTVHADFPALKNTSEVDHNFYPWRGSQLKTKWTDIVKKNI